jgi:hypothetical protein
LAKEGQVGCGVGRSRDFTSSEDKRVDRLVVEAVSSAISKGFASGDDRSAPDNVLVKDRIEDVSSAGVLHDCSIYPSVDNVKRVSGEVYPQSVDVVTTYPFIQAAYDFGKRKGPTLGLMFHGAEAESGVVGYLSRDPARHVSANFVCERSGRMVRMLNIDNASGSMNPADRSTDKAYYGHKHLVAVLGDWWRDPNSAVISVEIEMYARLGPNDAQVNSLIAWSKDMKSRYRSIRGALGHADQTDTKGCPGTTAKMRLVFSQIGGHGLWGAAQEAEDDMPAFTIQADAKSGTIEVTSAGHYYLRFDDPVPLRPIDLPFSRTPAFGPIRLNETIDGRAGGDERKVGYLARANDGGAFFVLKTDCRFLPATAGDVQRTVTLSVDGQEKAKVLV